MPQDDPQASRRRPLQEVVDRFGPPEGAGPISPQEAELYRGRVPEALIDFWLTYGRGGWRNGLWWLCDPEPLMPVMRALLRNDPEIDADLCVPYLRDAFGEITAWHPRLKLVVLNMNLGQVSNTDITGVRPGKKFVFDDNHAVASPVDGSVFYGRGWVDAVTGTPVFDAVLKRLGPVTKDQAYVMVPHFRMGGSGLAQDFSVGGLVEYLGILTQLGPFTRMKYIDPANGGRKPYGHSEPVRTIGSTKLLPD